MILDEFKSPRVGLKYCRNLKNKDSSFSQVLGEEKEWEKGKNSAFQSM